MARVGSAVSGCQLLAGRSVAEIRLALERSLRPRLVRNALRGSSKVVRGVVVRADGLQRVLVSTLRPLLLVTQGEPALPRTLVKTEADALRQFGQRVENGRVAEQEAWGLRA
jgi:hypothetical protein